MRLHRRREGFVLRPLGPRTVIVPVHAPIPHDVLLYLLDGPVARLLWDELEQERTDADLVAAVLDAFAAERPVVEADVAAFLEQLTTLGALETRPA